MSQEDDSLKSIAQELRADESITLVTNSMAPIQMQMIDQKP